jgi:hypothetical protein
MILKTVSNMIFLLFIYFLPTSLAAANNTFHQRKSREPVTRNNYQKELIKEANQDRKKRRDSAKKKQLQQKEKNKILYNQKEEQEKQAFIEVKKNAEEPCTFVSQFDARHFFGNNLQLLNSKNSFDNYFFTQYTFDGGLYIHPHSHYGEKESVEFKVTGRVKGNAGNVSRYTQTQRKKSKVGWAITELDEQHATNKMMFWIRNLWIKYHFDKDKSTSFTAGLFPFSVGHGIALGNASVIGQPLPGNYTLQEVDQFRPGVLLSSKFYDNRMIYQLYLGTLATYSDNYLTTGEFSNAQNLEKTDEVSRGEFKGNYVFAGQLSCKPYTSETTNTLCSSYLIFNHNNNEHVEFQNDSSSRLLTLGAFAELKNGSLEFSVEGARNFGSQKVKKWDRNTFTFGAKTFNTHLFFINPEEVTAATNPAYPSIGIVTGKITPTDYNNAIEGALNTNSIYTQAIGLTSPNNFSRTFANGEIFGLPTPIGSTPATIVYKNSYSRFRKAYTNSYEGWFIVADANYQSDNRRFGGSLGIISGDNNPNDTQDFVLASRRTSGLTYKDINKDYKGFVGVQEMFTSKSIKPKFIHEAQKLNCPLTACDELTKPMLSNLMFFGLGLHNDSVINQKEFSVNTNIIAYVQHKKVNKGTNLSYADFQNITFSTAQQEDRLKKLDTFLGFELNVSTHYKIAHDLNFYCNAAVFIPGKYYSEATGKYIPIKNQIDFNRADNTGIQDVEEKFNITLSNDPALLISIGLTYNFDSLLVKKRNQLYKK